MRRASLLPPGSACEICGTTDTLKLDANLAPIRCADHSAMSDGRPESHHIGGRGWDIVLDLTPNWHRIVTALQRIRKGATNGRFSELLYGIAELIYAIADHVAQNEGPPR
jgi:hypothetical protein